MQTQMAHTSATRRRATRHAAPSAAPVRLAAPARTAQPRSVLVARLHELGSAWADIARGFASCADLSSTSLQRTLLRQRALQCSAAHARLATLLAALHAQPLQRNEPERSGMAAYGTLCGLRDSSMAAECERCEAQARALCLLALEQPMPDALRCALGQELRESDTSLQRIRALRDALHGAGRDGA